MNISEYKLLEELTLSKHHYPAYQSENEGLIYIGLPEIVNFKSNREKQYFAYYLCLFVAFDLKVFEMHEFHYNTLKVLLKIPKFKYGLTWVMIYPERIYNHYKVDYDKELFTQCFNNYENYIVSSFEDNNINIDWRDFKEKMMNDSDLNCGSFGVNFSKHLKATLL